MKINLDIYEYNGENHSPFKGCVSMAVYTDNPHDAKESVSLMRRFVLNKEGLAELCKFYGVRAGEIGVSYSLSDSDGLFYSDYEIYNYNGDSIETGDFE